MIKFLIYVLIVDKILSERYDYLVFTLEWPPTFCEYIKCSFDESKVTGWNIHGLWPANYQHPDPFNCSGLDFNVDDLQSIYNDLLIQWANLKNFHNPSKFWAFEWTKHGTCAISAPLFPNELSYFNNSLRLKSFISLDKILSDNDIYPSADKQYDTDSVIKSISNKVSVLPKLECIKIERHGKEDYYLSAVEICFDRSLSPIDCPRHHHDNLGNLLSNLIHQIFQIMFGHLLGDVKKPFNEPCKDKFYIPPFNKSVDASFDI